MIWDALVMVLGELALGWLALALIVWTAWTVSSRFRSWAIDYFTEQETEPAPRLYDYEREGWF